MKQIPFRFKERNPVCGTRYAYVQGCRCPECKEANNLYLAIYKADARFKRGLKKPGRPAKNAGLNLSSEQAWASRRMK